MKRFLYFLYTALVIVSIGCSREDSDELPDQNPLRDITLRFDVRLNPETAATRSPRELLSSDVRQKVTDLRIYVFYSESGAEGSFTYYCPQVRDKSTGMTSPEPCFTMDAFATEKPDDDVWDDEQKGGHETHTTTFNPKLPEGYYRFLAVGRDDEPDAGENPYTIPMKPGITKWEEVSFVSSSSSPKANEVFAGYNANGSIGEPMTIHVTGSATFTASLTLRRHVAGILLNVKNIPASLVSEYTWNGADAVPGVQIGKEYAVDVVAVISPRYHWDMPLTRHSIGSRVILPSSRLQQSVLAEVRTSPDSPKDETGEYYTNETPGVDRYLSGSFVFPSRVSEARLSDAEGNPLMDNAAKPLIPEEASSASLYLAFFHLSIDGTSYYPLKLIPIKIARSENIGDDGYSDEDRAISSDGRNFNLLGNHLYCIGRRNFNDDINDPVDLKEVLTHPELEITVIGSWQADVDIEM